MTPASTRVVHDRAQLAEVIADLRRSGEPVATGVVMTMGALHAGHRELIKVARGRCAVTVVTVFLNPLQFGPGEDLTRYPRTLDADVQLCRDEGVDVVFAPDAAEIYPTGEPRVRIDAGPLGDVLEGRSRPGHFAGVLTVVAKLLHLTQPDFAFFGRKDAQQLLLIERMVQDIDFPVTVVPVPTVREPDGLALSSRNSYLAAADRASALALSRALRAGAAEAEHGAAAVRRAAQAVLAAEPAVAVDYLVLVHPRTLGDVADDHEGPALLAVAARVGTTRLIDNVLIDNVLVAI